MTGWQWYQLVHTQIICTSLHGSRQTTMLAPHYSTGRMIFHNPHAQPSVKVLKETRRNTANTKFKNTNVFSDKEQRHKNEYIHNMNIAVSSKSRCHRMTPQNVTLINMQQQLTGTCTVWACNSYSLNALMLFAELTPIIALSL